MLAILAQANGDDAAGIAVVGVCMMFALGFVVLAMLPHIFFLLTLSKALGRCSPRNRTQEPGLVWLALIPFVNLVWSFINVVRVAESLENEFRDRRWHARGEDYGRGIGIAHCCLVLGCMIPYLNILIAIPSLVCWIMYWVKIANLSGQLESGSYSEYGDFDEEEEEREERRRRRERDDDRGDEDDRDEDDRDDRKPWERGRR